MIANIKEAGKHLLLQYENDRKFIYGELSTFANTAGGFDVPYLIGVLNDRFERIANIEKKLSIATTFMIQLEQSEQSEKTDKSSEPTASQ